MDEKRGIGERGPDKEKRDYNKKSLFNLKQFQKPVPNQTVNPAVNSGVNWSKVGMIVLIVITAGLAHSKSIENRKKYP